VLRIIDGQVFEGKPSTDRWIVTINDLGNGQKEASIQRATDWVHDGPLDPDSILAQVLRGEREDPEAEHKERANRKRAARRAKTKVRRLCKAFGLDTMFTLTYRENQTDLDTCKKHVKAFVRRVKRYIPGFRYVAAYEPQERGAWHVHMAVKAIDKRFRVRGAWVKSYDVLRSTWRAVVGLDNGTVNVSDGRPGGRRGRVKRRSPARLAAYMSKYMLKGFEEGELFANRYSASEQVELPKPQRMEFVKTSLAELVSLVYDEIAVGCVEIFNWLSRFGDVFYIATEPEKPRELLPWEI